MAKKAFDRNKLRKKKPKNAKEEVEAIKTDLAAELSAYVIRLEMESAQLRRDVRQVLGVGNVSPFLEEFRNNYQPMFKKTKEDKDDQQYLEKVNKSVPLNYEDRKKILDSMLYGNLDNSSKPSKKGK